MRFNLFKKITMNLDQLNDQQQIIHIISKARFEYDQKTSTRTETEFIAEALVIYFQKQKARVWDECCEQNESQFNEQKLEYPLNRPVNPYLVKSVETVKAKTDQLKDASSQ